MQISLSRKQTLLISIFLLSMCVRLVFLFQLQSTPLFGVFAPDTQYYDQFAIQILAGDFTFPESVYLHPLYPLFLAFLYLFLGHSFVAVALSQIILDSLTCLLLYFISLKVFSSKTVGIMASFFYALYSMAIFYTGFVLDVTLLAFLCVVLILIVVYSVQKWRSWVLAGFVMAAIVLLKANMALFAPVLIGWYLFSNNGKAKLRNAGLFVAAFLIVLIPFSIRNYAIVKSFSPVPLHGGMNFYLGNNPRASGTFKSLYGMADSPIEHTKISVVHARKFTGKSLTLPEANLYWFKKSIIFMVSDPYAFSRLLFRKFKLFWSAEEIPLNLDYYFCKDMLPLLRFPLFSFGVIAPLAVLGMWFSVRYRKYKAGIIGLFVLSSMTATVLFFVSARHRFLIVPFLIIFASYAVYNLKNLAEKKRIKEVVFSLIAMSIIAFFVYRGVFSPNMEQRFYVPYVNLGEVYKDKGMFKEAIQAYRKALYLQPDYADVYCRIGLVYHALGDNKKAVEMFKESIRKNPFQADPYYNLGVIYRNDKVFADEAEMLFKKSIAIMPQADAYYNLGMIYWDKGDADRAIKYFSEARQLFGKEGNSAGVSKTEELIKSLRVSPVDEDF